MYLFNDLLASKIELPMGNAVVDPDICSLIEAGWGMNI